MKNPQDVLGNELVEGQHVVIHVSQPTLIHATVVKVSPGGIVAALDKQGRGGSPAIVVMQATFPFQVQPGGRVPGVVRVIDPTAQAAVESFADTANERPA